jgi:translation initiation factor IF-3
VVRVNVIFRGRENIHPEFGIKILERIIEETKAVAKIESCNITINKDNYYFIVLKNK